MLHIITAFHCEASPIIDYFNLKKAIGNNPEYYYSDEISLSISGLGKVKSAVATTAALNNKEKEEAIAINIGIAAASSDLKIGQLYFVNKVINSATNQTFFPDILLEHNLPEAELLSVDTPQNKQTDAVSTLYDMEGCAFFEAASTFLFPHQIALLKIASDHCNINKVTPQKTTALIKNNLKEIVEVLNRYSSSMQNEQVLEIPHLSVIIKNLKLTKMQADILKEQTLSFYIRGGNINALLKFIDIESTNKNDSKKYLKTIIESFKAV